METKKLFLVDNDDIFCFAAEVLIKSRNLAHEVARFENGHEALNALRTLADSPDELPAILLLDLNMPIMSGWEFLDEIKTGPEIFTKKIAIYILTSSIAPEDVTKSKDYPFLEGYITKPLTVEDIDRVSAK